MQLAADLILVSRQNIELRGSELRSSSIKIALVLPWDYSIVLQLTKYLSMNTII